MLDSKNKVKSLLDNLVDDEGLKTDITLTMTNQTLIKTAGTLFITATAITVMVFAIRGIVKNSEIVKA